MNSHYSAGQEEDSLEPSSLDGSISDMLSGMNTASKLSRSASKTDCSMKPRSLQTCVSSHSPVQPENTEDLRMWLAAAFPASRSQSQGNEKQQTMNEICGPQCVTLSKLSVHPMCTLKTSQDYSQPQWMTPQADLFTTLERYSETWPKWGMVTSGGECWGLQMSGLTTNAKGSGLWQTPVADDSVNRENGKYNSRGEPHLSGQVKLLHTPTAKANQMSPDMIKKGSGWWLTPTASESKTDPVKFKKRMEKYRNGTTVPNLATQVANSDMWPTPASRDWKGGRKLDTLEAAGRNENNSLPDKVNASHGDTGALNPDWVELLMGWPRSWSSLEPIESLEWDADWSEWEQDVPRVTKGTENRAKRLKAIGNGQVPLTVATAWRILTGDKHDTNK